MFPAIKFLIILGLAVVVTRADQRQQVVDFHRPCLDHHEIDDNDLHFALDKLKSRDDDEFYLHFFCVAKQGHFMTEDGTVNTDNFENDMKGIIDEENMSNVAAIVRMCLIQKDTVLETVRHAVDCFMAADHNL